jgi:tripartite-type tricarboxylate transporter receptor subunit TctC
LARAAGIQIRPVHYKGTAPMLLDTATGQVHLTIGFLAEVDKQYIQTGKVVPIGALAPRRISRFPDVPTMTEQGFQGFEVVSWTGLFMPAGTPKAIVDKLNAAVTKIIREPDFVAWLAETGSEVPTPTPEQFREFVRGELAGWRKSSDELGIRLE